MSSASVLALADDLIALAVVRGDGAAVRRWQSTRAVLAGDPHSGATGSWSSLPPEVAAALDLLRQSGWVLREQAIAELPFDLRWLFEANAITLTQLEPLTQTLRSTTLADLLDRIADGGIQSTPGLGIDAATGIARALPTLREQVTPVPLGRALDITEPLLEYLRADARVAWAEPVGSLRRGHELIGDLELVACGDTQAAVLDATVSAPGVDRVAYRSLERATLVVGRMQVTIRCHGRPEAPAQLLWSTGSRAHREQLQTIARERRLVLDEGGLTGLDGSRRVLDTEAAIYEALGLPWIPPELRRGGDEIADARRGALPDLVERGDMLGDLHMHSRWSDGRDSVEAMAEAAAALGYRYIAMTNHSPRSDAVKNLQIDDISRQADEIAAVRERFPQMAILHGCEVDILPDGTLDFPDKVLRRFDIVLASLHNRAGHSAPQLFRRYLSAMVHPLVTIITHPTNRLFPKREGYDLDYERLFEAAVETRTVLEIDGAASHLDLDAGLAALAAGRGVTLAIDSDAHSTIQLGRHMQAGILTARRGGVKRDLVLNSRPLPQVRALIAAKRSRVAP